MKFSVVAFSVLMVMAFSSLASSAPRSVNSSPLCCYTYTSRKISKHHVISYVETGNQCSQPGVVFTTDKGMKMCANPRDSWVQEYINALKSRSKPKEK